jgi:hypothetical protein
MRCTRWAWGATLALGAAACAHSEPSEQEPATSLGGAQDSGGAAGTDGVSSGPVTSATFGPLLVAELCRQWQSCDAAWLSAAFGDVGCQVGFGALISDMVTPWPAFAFDEALAHQCLEQTQALECAYLFAPVCAQVFSGQSKSGASCIDDRECAAGLLCDGDCPGTCVPAPQADQPCLEGRCSKGFSCNPDARCHADSGLGEPCRSSCAPQLACDEVSELCADPNQLYARHPAGADCAQQFDCSGELECRSGACVASVKGEGCGATASCTLGFYCSELDAGCAVVHAPGQDCDKDAACGAAGFCTDQGVCAPRRAFGQACERYSECASLRCLEGICRAPEGCRQ